MSIAAIWDRFWWSLMLTIFIGLVWLKFIDPIFPRFIVGALVSGACGIAYFIRGILHLLQVKRNEALVEQKAREELLAEYGKVGVEK